MFPRRFPPTVKELLGETVTIADPLTCSDSGILTVAPLLAEIAVYPCKILPLPPPSERDDPAGTLLASSVPVETRPSPRH